MYFILVYLILTILYTCHSLSFRIIATLIQSSLVDMIILIGMIIRSIILVSRCLATDCRRVPPSFLLVHNPLEL